MMMHDKTIIKITSMVLLAVIYIAYLVVVGFDGFVMIALSVVFVALCLDNAGLITDFFNIIRVKGRLQNEGSVRYLRK